MYLNYEIKHLFIFLVSAFQEANVAANEDGQSIVDPEAVIEQLKDENSSLKGR